MTTIDIRAIKTSELKVEPFPNVDQGFRVVMAESALAAVKFALDLFCGNWLPEGYEIAGTLQGPGAVPLPADLVERLRDRNPVLLRAGISIEEADARTQLAS